MRVCCACVSGRRLTCRSSASHIYCLFDICYRHNADFMNIRLKSHVQVWFKKIGFVMGCGCVVCSVNV